MAITVVLNIPGQPAAGALELVPLGGNGYTSPHSFYAFEVISAGDVSGGTNLVYVRPDERYTSLVPYVMTRVTGLAADVVVEVVIAATALDRVTQDQTIAFTTSNFAGHLVWRPPPMIIQTPGRTGSVDTPWLRWETANVDGEGLNCIGRIYNFAIDVREKISLPVILSSIPS